MVTFSMQKRLSSSIILISMSAIFFFSGCLEDRLTPEQMVGQTVEASLIGLPTGGAVVTTSTLVLATDAGNTNGEYCKVEGNILPSATDPVGTPNIRFQLNLPTNWNYKIVQMGGGGYNGKVVTGTGAFGSGAPLALGYATFGSDSGHVSSPTPPIPPEADATFATNEGALLNFGYQHIKKTHDTAVELIKRYYGISQIKSNFQPKSYFVGSSTGGREGLTAAQRFPKDYDGIVVTMPAINHSGIRFMGVKIGQLTYGTTGGYINDNKITLLNNTVLSNCDADDGVVDGIISNVLACKEKYDTIKNALRCADGTDLGNTCLSDTQLAAVDLINSGMTLPYTLANNVSIIEGYNILSGASFRSLPPNYFGLGLTPFLFTPPAIGYNGYLFPQSDVYLKYFVTNNASFNSLTFDIDNPGAYQARLVTLSDIVGATNPDLSAFRHKGGKLIILHGLADEVTPTNGTINYYNLQVARDNQRVVNSYIRFYTVPGFGHGTGVFVPSWDAMGALDSWVSLGEAPEVLLGTDTVTATAGRTRPLCRFPQYPRYNGTGDPNIASSYTCTDP